MTPGTCCWWRIGSLLYQNIWHSDRLPNQCRSPSHMVPLRLTLVPCTRLPSHYTNRFASLMSEGPVDFFEGLEYFSKISGFLFVKYIQLQLVWTLMKGSRKGWYDSSPISFSSNCEREIIASYILSIHSRSIIRQYMVQRLRIPLPSQFWGFEEGIEPKFHLKMQK